MTPAEEEFREVVRRSGFGIKLIVDSLEDAKPVWVQLHNLDPDNPRQMQLVEELMTALRKLYRSLGGDDLIFTFRDAEGREMANPLPTCDILVTPFDMPDDEVNHEPR
jgi:hypothetical protein